MASAGRLTGQGCPPGLALAMSVESVVRVVGAAPGVAGVVPVAVDPDWRLGLASMPQRSAPAGSEGSGAVAASSAYAGPEYCLVPCAGFDFAPVAAAASLNVVPLVPGRTPC